MIFRLHCCCPLLIIGWLFDRFSWFFHFFQKERKKFLDNTRMSCCNKTAVNIGADKLITVVYKNSSSMLDIIHNVVSTRNLTSLHKSRVSTKQPQAMANSADFYLSFIHCFNCLMEKSNSR